MRQARWLSSQGRTPEAYRRSQESENNVRLAWNADVGPISDEEAIHYHAFRFELTKQQLAAFEAALKLGYYAENDQATISDIASLVVLQRFKQRANQFSCGRSHGAVSVYNIG